jgi:ribosomal protein L11
MAKKELTAKIKLQVPGGQCTPAPRSALLSVSWREHRAVRQAVQRQDEGPDGPRPAGDLVYKDRSFDFILKSPPAAVLEARAQLAKGRDARTREGRDGHEETVRGDREDQDGGPRRRVDGRRDPHDRRHREVLRHRRGGLAAKQ